MRPKKDFGFLVFLGTFGLMGSSSESESLESESSGTLTSFERVNNTVKVSIKTMEPKRYSH
jgi:hypothetical protein